MKNILNESLTDIVYHFCDFKAAFNIVRYDTFFLTNVVDTARDRKLNSGKMYYMSFARHFNSNMGYVGSKNTNEVTLNVRIEVDGRILSQGYRGIQVNSLPGDADAIVNREQEDRLITDKPLIKDAHKYIRGIYICNPMIADESQTNLDGTPPKLLTVMRQQILYMMNKAGYENKVFVFNDMSAFNNLGNFKNIGAAINNGFIVSPELIQKLAVTEFTPNETYKFGKTAIGKIAYIYALLQYDDTMNISELFLSNGKEKFDLIWNQQVPKIKKCAETMIRNLQSNIKTMKRYKYYTAADMKKAMREQVFDARMGSRLRKALSGELRPFYSYAISPIYKYMAYRNVEDLNILISKKLQMCCEDFGIPYNSKLASASDMRMAAVESASKGNINAIVEKTIKSFLMTEDKTVTFNGQVNPKYGWAVFICGASGSGKSTAAKQHIPIQGKVLSSDYFREAYADLLNVRNNDLKYNFRNYGAMKSIKKKTEPNKQDKSGRWSGGHGFLQQLVGGIENSIATSKSGIRPNLIIDTLGVTKGATDWMFDTLKRIGGYKISFVWVLTNKDVAFVNNTQRDVIVPPDYLLKKHNQALGYDLTEKAYSVQNIFDNYSNVIDEAWIIVNSSFDDVDGQRVYRRPNQLENQSNVIKLQKINGVFQIPQTFGNDERKPFLGGRKNVSLRDITGDKATVTKTGGVGYPEINAKYIGSDGKPHIAPTDTTLNNIASTNPNNRILNNVDISHDAAGIANRTNAKINRLRNGQRGVSHSSLM